MHHQLSPPPLTSSKDCVNLRVFFYIHVGLTLVSQSCAPSTSGRLAARRLRVFNPFSAIASGGCLELVLYGALVVQSCE